MFNKILVCYDGSDHSEAAVRAATSLAGKYQSELQIAFIPELQTSAIAVGPEVIFVPVDESEIKERTDEMLARAVSIANDEGQVAVTTHVLRGTPAEAILAHAKDTNADLIVAGRRGLGTLRGLLVGSVSQKLNSHASCPVLTVQ